MFDIPAALDHSNGKVVQQFRMDRRLALPSKIVQVDEIPRTKSGKIVELAVREVVHNRAVKNIHSLANPEALDLYRGLPQLQE